MSTFHVGQRVYVPIELGDKCCVMPSVVGVVGAVFEISEGVIHQTLGQRYTIEYPNGFQGEFQEHLKAVFTPLTLVEQQEVCDLVNSILDISCDRE